VSESV